jgi:hypothetical protein
MGLSNRQIRSGKKRRFALKPDDGTGVDPSTPASFRELLSPGVRPDFRAPVRFIDRIKLKDEGLKEFSE